MYRREKTQERYKHDKKSPSFSSSLLDKIYRSIDEGDKHSGDLKVFTGTMAKKQTKSGGRSSRAMEEEDMASFRRACLTDKWMEKKAGDKVGAQRRQYYPESDRKIDHDNYNNDHDVMFFSSTSSSSDSSSGGFSSSDTESMHCTRSRTPSCFAPAMPKPKPVRTSTTSSRSEKTEKKQRTLLYEQRTELHMYDDCHRHHHHHNSSSTEHTPKLDEILIRSKSRALKIYSNLKKVKQPISPGGRLVNFLNSLFTAGTSKKSKHSSSVASCDYANASAERKSKSVQASSTCSSASSYSRSCLSKNSPTTREKLRNGVKRTVRFYPVSVIVDEDCRPCGHKCLYEAEQEENRTTLMPVTVPTAWKIGPSPTRKIEEEVVKHQVFEKSRRVEEAAREFLKDYRQNLLKNEIKLRDFRCGKVEEVDDDAASYSSSDLFELDHLALIGNERYREELPVYETTHVDTNRAIANGLIM
ncbi:protein BIG GRAIN 1-like B [Ziziphus jujuba]|uniref:Protein BIG GRAIN 1-like B n=2 Tax=Ziziphus jujuba TaxID=326968 RepID=A0A6P3ZWJ2_ZIZJJ|nr:protein BIG GRAIN 1-like B [Ziziphus jujuba]KAH7523863.1 hypothetical protein FEM48_Zijuj06G0057100 [Ziziphus jujuba var. spinosa]